MKKLLFAIVVPGICLAACKGKAKRAGSDPSTAKVETVAAPVEEEHAVEREVLDSSLVSLKKMGTVSTEAVMTQLWVFEDADKPHWNEIFWDPVKDKRQYPEMQLFPDHQVTYNPRCGLQTGKWKLNKDTRELELSFTDGSSKTYIVMQMALKQLELGWKSGGLATIRLKADGIVHKHKEEWPYYPSNLVWRDRPKAAESRDQLSKRIRGMVHFFALFFADNHTGGMQEISFEGFPSCLKWYNGGIGLVEKGEVEREWKDCFYSEDQAMKAYEMIGDQLSRHELKWPEHPTSWVEQTGQVLAQLEKKF